MKTRVYINTQTHIVAWLFSLAQSHFFVVLIRACRNKKHRKEVSVRQGEAGTLRAGSWVSVQGVLTSSSGSPECPLVTPCPLVPHSAPTGPLVRKAGVETGGGQG